MSKYPIRKNSLRYLRDQVPCQGFMTRRQIVEYLELEKEPLKCLRDQVPRDGFMTKRQVLEYILDSKMKIMDLYKKRIKQGYSFDGKVTKKMLLEPDVYCKKIKPLFQESDLVLDAEAEPEIIEESPIYNDFNIPQEHLDMAATGTIDPSKLTFTENLRLATVAKEFYEKNLAIRGVPISDNFTVDDHQERTIKWMWEIEKNAPNPLNGLLGGIVSLHMGLGKTLTFLLYTLSQPKGDFPTLVITSLTVLHEWKNECTKFFGDRVKILYLHKNFMENRIKLVDRKLLSKFDIVITTYDQCASICKKKEYHNECLVMGDPNSLMKDKIESIELRTRSQCDKPKVVGPGVIYCTPWHRVVCDESQRFANPKTKTFQYMMAIYGKYKWCLSGTPIRNYKTDIWAQMRFLGYNKVNTAIHWERSYKTNYKLHNLDKAILIMSYKQAGIELPKPEIHISKIYLEDKEKEVYDFINGKLKDAYDDFISGCCNYICVLAIFTALRQSVIAPYLLTPDSKRKIDENKRKTLEDVYNNISNKCELTRWIKDKNGSAGILSSKIRRAIEIIYSVPPDEKVIVFSMFASAIDILADALDENDTVFSLSNNTNDCPICLEEYNNKMYKMQCGHYACVDCLKRMNKKECPVCKASLYKIDRRIGLCIEMNRVRYQEDMDYQTLNDLRVADGMEPLPLPPRPELIYPTEVDEQGREVIDLTDDPAKIKPYQDIDTVKYAQIDGSVTGNDRADSLNSFRKNKKIKCLLTTYKTASEGLNLIEATHCIFIEPWWTPSVHDQSFARILRRGQNKVTHLYHILADNTIERKILEIQEKKRELANFFVNEKSVINSGPDSSLMRQLLIE